MKKDQKYEIAKYVTDGIEDRYVAEMSNFLKGASEPNHRMNPIWWIVAAAMLALVIGAATWNIVVNKNRQQTAGNKDDAVVWQFSYLTASEFHEDGWYFCFDKFFYKDGSEADDVMPYTFWAMNLRYRHADQQSHAEETGNVQNTAEGNEDASEAESFSGAAGDDAQWDGPYDVMWYGGSSGLAVKDMAYINNFLKGTTDEELLALRAEDLPFTEIDPEWFIGLVKTALTAEAHREGNYVDIGSMLLAEPEFADGYKFQIGCVVFMGCIDAMYIDVLYESDTAPYGYVQLSDMVDAGTATAQQAELFELLQSISADAVSQNNLLSGFDKNRKKELAGIELSRLYSCLEDMEKNNLDRYYQPQ